LLLVSTVPIMVLGAWDWYGVGLAALAVAIGVAILRYRLYDIDVVINKTVVYASLAVFIGAVYVAVVVGLGTLLGSQGEPNAALSIFATAIVAIAFQPVRERVQRFANRLVYGQRATPYEVLARFSETVATLGADELLAHTAATLRDATGALGACVWLRSGAELTTAAAAPPETLPDLGPAGLVDGGLPELPGDGSAAIVHQEELLGALTITKAKGDPLTPRDRQVLAALASQAGEVVRNASLTAALQARLEQLTAQAEELRRSRQRIVAAEDDERRSLERNIHDGAQQHLVALAVKLKLARTLAARAPDKAKVVVTQLRAQVDDTVAALRELASGIYPSVLEARGIVAALEAQTQSVPVPVTIEGDGLGRYPIESEATAYFCCLEALQNVAKYAWASHARVSLAERDGELGFSVRDDGRGFDPDTTPFGSGLRNIADRVGAAQGTVTVESAPGAGTTVTGRIPATRLEAAA
jgi:signal transduction histidine kinase